MAPQYRWSLITVTFNCSEQLAEYWSSVDLPVDVEWLVVDNASTDASAEVARSLGARVITLGRNVGFGAANNVGFAHSSGANVMFVNPDVTPQAIDLSVLDRHLSDHPRDLVSPQLINPDGTSQPNGRGLPYLVHKVRNRTSPDELVGSYLKLAAPGEEILVDWLMGASVAGTREWIGAIDVWDKHFFVYYEDADLGLRNSRRGGRSVVLGDIRWVHGWARATNRASFAAWKREIPSMLKFYRRYPHLLTIPSGSRGKK